MKLNEKIIKECEKIINKDKDRLTWKELAKKYGFTDGEILRQKFKAYRKKNGTLPSIDETVLKKYGIVGEGNNKQKESIQINKDGSQCSEKSIEIDDKEKLKDEKFLLESHGYDVSKWEIVNFKASTWDTQLKGGKVVELCSSKLTVKPRVNPAWTREIIKDVILSLDNIPRKTLNINLNRNDDSEKLLFVRPADFHYNLKSTMLVTGNEYNTEIAEKYLRYVIDETYNRVKDIKFEKVLFTIGDDFINADNIQGSTTAGTPQDNELPWEEAFRGATRLIRDCIENLREIAPVDVVNIQSNHDQHTMFGISEALGLRYEDCDSINIINNPQPIQEYVYGSNLMYLAHDINVKEALKIISSKGKKHWSHCNNIMCILAHKHQSMQYERMGELEMFRLPTISGWSRWANGKGYHHCEKRADIYIIDKNNGITDKKVIPIMHTI